MQLTRANRRLLRALVVGLAFALALGACANTERLGIRVARTASVEPGIRLILDNCPAPEQITLSVRDEVLWQVESPDAPTDDEPDTDDEADDSSAEDSSTDAPTTTSADTAGGTVVADGQPPGLLEVLVGAPPAGWTTTQELEQPLRDDTRYTVTTEPDGKTVEFAIPNLGTRTLYDGETATPFQPSSLREPCEEPADVGAFVDDLTILAALWITAAALVLVALIMILFVITRRFSRIRTIERRAALARAELERQLIERADSGV